MANISKFNPSMCSTIIEMGKEGASLTEMAVKIGISRETFNQWRHKNEVFESAVKEALAHSQAWWEERARDATFGKIPGFNATAFIFQMKNRFGQDYRDVHRTEVSGVDGAPLFQQVTFNVIDSRNQEPLSIDHDPLTIDHEPLSIGFDRDAEKSE